jgi:hypothetical protein
LLGIGCPSHIIHNAAQDAAEKMDYDFEMLATKIAGHFTGRSQRMEEFQEFVKEHEVIR